MTISEIRSSDKLFLIPSDVAPVLGCDPQNIRVAAQSRPELLGFPVSVVGNRVKIPRSPFLRFVGDIHEEVNNDNSTDRTQ